MDSSSEIQPSSRSVFVADGLEPRVHRAGNTWICLPQCYLLAALSSVTAGKHNAATAFEVAQV